MGSAPERLVNACQANNTHFSQLLQEVERPGAMRGQIEVKDDFDAPLDELFDVLS